MKKISVGVIGTGTMGIHHVRLFAAMPGVRLIGVADGNPAAIWGAVEAYRVPGFADFRDLLAFKPDAVSIAVPTSQHESVALTAIRAGCHVLLEKPIAGNSNAARRIIRAAAAGKVKLMIGHTERFNPAVTAVKRALKGEKIISFDITRVGPLPPRVKDVGIIIDLAIHDIDLLRHLTGAEVSRVTSLHRSVSGAHEDTAMILLKLENGVMAHITTNWLTPFKARLIQVATLGKFIRADLLNRTVSVYSRVPKTEDGGLVKEIPVADAEPLRLELEAFIRSVRTGTPVPVSGEDGLRALRVAESCLLKSLR
jgi:UDP-N-acetylglucosamine 3-dehydrogenase